MWLETEHKHIDELGHKSEQTITVNMDRVLTYHERKDGTTRIYFELGHDIEDHRSASWMDVLTPKKKIDRILSTKRASSNRDLDT